MDDDDTWRERSSYPLIYKLAASVRIADEYQVLRSKIVARRITTLCPLSHTYGKLIAFSSIQSTLLVQLATCCSMPTPPLPGDGSAVTRTKGQINFKARYNLQTRDPHVHFFSTCSVYFFLFTQARLAFHPLPQSLPMSSQGVNGGASSSPALGTAGSTSETLGWVAPPSGLELTQVHYLIRHGERTPVRERLQKANPPIPARWNLCHASRDFRVQVLDVGKGSQVQTKNWMGETLHGTPNEMQVQRRVEVTDDKDNALKIRPGDW
jgi:hypothetical protein